MGGGEERTLDCSCMSRIDLVSSDPLPMADRMSLDAFPILINVLRAVSLWSLDDGGFQGSALAFVVR